MIFSGTTEYAIRGLAELALAGEGKRVLLDELVAGTTLPRDFMAKVFQRLAKGGILHSAKGRGGGFSLSRDAATITLMDIVVALEGRQIYDRCVVGLEKCNDAMPCPQHDLYKPMRQRWNEYLNTTTLADLASTLKAKKAYLLQPASPATVEGR